MLKDILAILDTNKKSSVTLKNRDCFLIYSTKKRKEIFILEDYAKLNCTNVSRNSQFAGWDEHWALIFEEI